MPKHSSFKKTKSFTDKPAGKMGVKEVPEVKEASEVKEVTESVKPMGSKKPSKFVKLLTGTQFTDRDSGDLYILGRMTPVESITNWVRIQEKHGLFEIVE